MSRSKSPLWQGIGIGLILALAVAGCGSSSSAASPSGSASAPSSASGAAAPHSPAATGSPSASAVSTATTTTAAGPPLTRLHTEGAKILDADGAPFVIKAANWFGLETSSCAPDGLWQISLDSGMATIAGLGFNSIRLPYSSECIERSAPATGIDATKNPTLQGKTPLQIMDAVVASAKAHGLRVILDRHRPDSAAQSELWYTAAYPESTWIRDWVMLAKRYRGDPAVIGADLDNEPHGSACWGCGVASRDWAAAATRAGNAISAVDPHLLIIVEGIEKSANGTYALWGGQLQDVAAHPLSLKVRNQLVYSPHDFPSSVSMHPWFTAKNYPANLPTVWDTNFGYIQKKNLAPVLVGEFGTKLQTASDKLWMQEMVGYLAKNKMSFGYWAFNPEGNTGGLVQADWSTPEAAKVVALKALL